MTDLIEELGLIATQAEKSSAFTDEAQWMRTDGVADVLYRAIDRIEQLEAALRLYAGFESNGIKWEPIDDKGGVARAALAGEKKDD